jgi:hypothetical protein
MVPDNNGHVAQKIIMLEQKFFFKQTLEATPPTMLIYRNVW